MQRECNNITAEAGSGSTQLQVKESQGLAAPPKAGEEEASLGLFTVPGSV